MRKTEGPAIAGRFWLGVLVFVAGLVAGFVLRPAFKKVPEETTELSTVLKEIPDVRQATNYSCGAAALQAVLSYWGIDRREWDLMQDLKTSPETGTSPEDIIRVAKETGLGAYLRENLELRDLEESVNKGIPVIAAIQARADVSAPGFSWDKTWEDGHYVIIISLDERNIYVEDPSLLGTRGAIPREEFLARWHDYTGSPPLDETDRVYKHLGIFISGKKRAKQAPISRVS